MKIAFFFQNVKIMCFFFVFFFTAYGFIKYEDRKDAEVDIINRICIYTHTRESTLPFYCII